MNKAQLTDAVAAATDTSKAEAGRAVEATLNAIAGSLAGGDSVSLVGFGTFNVRHRAARTGRNPQTGATIQIAASKSVGFTQSSQAVSTATTRSDFPQLYSLASEILD